MGDPRSEEFLRPYRDAVRTFGAGFEATLWTSRDAQRTRFDVMIDLAGFEGSSIVDVGCGHGDFAAHLLTRGVAYASYVGLDALPEVIEAARGRGIERAAFELRNVVDETPLATLEHVDFVCVSGTLNTMDEATARTLVERCFEGASQAVVFNFLSDRPHARFDGRPTHPARRFDTLDWIDWSLGLSSRVAFTQAYMDGHDATIAIWHDGDA